MKKKNSELPEIPSTRGDDIHNIEYRHSADLVLFLTGNHFMVMEDLLKEFQTLHPGIHQCINQENMKGQADSQRGAIVISEESSGL
jgi:hypothetical protein